MESIDPVGSAGCFIWSFNYSVIWLMLFHPAKVQSIHFRPPMQSHRTTLKTMKVMSLWESDRVTRGCRLEKWSALASVDFSLYSIPQNASIQWLAHFPFFIHFSLLSPISWLLAFELHERENVSFELKSFICAKSSCDKKLFNPVAPFTVFNIYSNLQLLFYFYNNFFKQFYKYGIKYRIVIIFSV